MVSPKEVLKDYWLGKQIGKGARSRIYSVKGKGDGKPYAVKFVEVQNSDDKRIVRHLDNEYEVLSDIHEKVSEAGRRIVRPIDFQKFRQWFSLKAAYLVMEHVPGKSLATTTDYAIDSLIRIFRQVCEGLEIVHQAGYVHADLKPDNILVSKKQQVKLIDFGFAAKVGTKISGFKGTWGYVAPEQAGGLLTARTDVFNLGAAMYEAFTGEKVPSISPDDRNAGGFVPDEQINLTPPWKIDRNIPQSLSDLILECCQFDVHQRPKLKKVKTGLNDVLLHMEMSRG